jgi:hypothetical protein
VTISVAYVVSSLIQLALIGFAIACIATPRTVLGYFTRSWRKRPIKPPAPSELLAWRVLGFLLMGQSL